MLKILRAWTAPVIALLAVVLLSTLAHAEQPIRLWHAYRGAEQQALEQIVAGFDGRVELLAVPYDAFASKLESTVPLGKGPHVYIDAHERLGDYAERGIVAGVPFELEPGAYASKTVAAVTINGQLLAVPLSQKCLALYINTDLVGTAPTTLEEIAALAPALPAGSFALAYEARGAYAHAAVLAAFGGALLDVETNDFGFEGPAAARSLEFVASLISTGVVPEDADGALVTNLFAAGQAATAISGPWLAADLGDAVPYRVTLLPTIAAGEQGAGERMRPLLTVEAVMLSPKGAADPDALRLVQHLSSAASAQVRAEVARSVSARADLPTSEDPVLAAFAAQAKLAEPTPSTAAMRAVWEPANRAIRKYLRGDVSADAALAEARRRFDDVRRPPPPPADPAPLLIALGLLSLVGAGLLVHRARTRDGWAALQRSLPAYRYVAFGVIAVGILVILPIVFGAGAALFAGKPHDMYFVGLANFREILTARGGPLLSTGSFYVVLAVTVLWTIVNVGFHLGIGVALGLVLSRPVMRLRGLYRVLLIVPWAVPSYVTALAWRGMFHRQFGAVTGLIHAINDLLGTSIEPIAWFARFSTAFAANVATNVWLGFPFMMVVTLGALAAVPKDVLEAAEVDGASRWQRLSRVTLPIIAPSMVPAVTLGAIWTFNMFNVVFLVSGGDPDGTTDILVSEAYRWAFTREAQYGYAAAYAVLIFLLLLATSRVTDRLMNRGRPQ
ncbi:Maltose/maltodextrin ABC transporter, permease protein MalF [Enhygromyxa salina]|uniref:Maltose/maltodextrin ABC transporter, permease protein MalF n=1 Tax=Enhygromyxa salina TaxID=215803 RepID=A0A0C1ZZ86_9BACT|nr:extracellular solute-binding protein [Enhygromyxa salina]KIG16538.1 Maltose/maltodextrin ABC transporter, permease protein MalF [Enhygromyxa salina]